MDKVTVTERFIDSDGHMYVLRLSNGKEAYMAILHDACHACQRPLKDDPEAEIDLYAFEASVLAAHNDRHARVKDFAEKHGIEMRKRKKANHV